MKNILITGSGGFIGSHLKTFLGGRYNLLVPRRKDLNLLDSTAVDNYFKNNKIDFIVHLASCGVRITADATLDDVAKPNIQMFKNLSTHVSKECPMMTVGSGAEYDKSEPLVKVKEADFGKRVPKDPYGYSKYMISKEIEHLDNILNLRLFGIYGYGEDSSRVTSCIINDNLALNTIKLNQNVRFHFLYISDFCKIIEYFIMNFPKDKFINVAPNDSIEIVDLANIVNDFSKHHSDIKVKQVGFNKEYTADNSLLLKYMPGFQFTSYEQGMKELYLLMRKSIL